MFRTPTGQTGQDAYIYEAAQIMNAQRDLNTRFHRLIETVRKEAPDTFRASSDYGFKPNATKAEHFLHYIQGSEHYIDWLHRRR